MLLRHYSVQDHVRAIHWVIVPAVSQFHQTLLPSRSIVLSHRIFINTSSLADVDGTLIESVGTDSNKLHKEAFTEAFKQVFEIDTHIDVIRHHGGTDPLVLMRVLMEVHGVGKEKCMQRMEDMKKAMLAYYSSRKERYGPLNCMKIHELHEFQWLHALLYSRIGDGNRLCSAGDGLQLLPGVRDAMEKLKALPNVRTALVTGVCPVSRWFTDCNFDHLLCARDHSNRSSSVTPGHTQTNAMLSLLQ